jgi:hypothetical protein
MVKEVGNYFLKINNCFHDFRNWFFPEGEGGVEDCEFEFLKSQSDRRILWVWLSEILADLKNPMGMGRSGLAI